METIKEVLNGRLPCSALEQELISECDDRDKRIKELVEENELLAKRIDDQEQGLAAYEKQLDAVREWQPIETAPKDFTLVLGWCKNRGFAQMEILQRDDGLMIHFGCITAHESMFKNPPTHWMPLPEPPEDK